MATEQFVNNYASSLTVAVTSTTATSLTVASATGAPSTGPFRILVDSEIMVVGSVSGTMFSDLTRGAEGTTAATHATGAAVTHILTAGALGAVLRSSFGLAQFTPPPSTGWSWDNQGTGSVDSSFGYEYLDLPSAGATANLRARYRTAPSAPYTITACRLHDVSGAPSADTSANNGGYGLCFRDASGKLVTFNTDSVASGTLAVAKWNSSLSANSTYWSQTDGLQSDFIARNPTWLRLFDDGTDIGFAFSVDGNHWVTIWSGSETDFFAARPTQVGLVGYVNRHAIRLALLSWSAS